MSSTTTLVCPRCGATLPLDPTRQTVRCSYCTQEVQVPIALRSSVLEYSAAVAPVVDAAWQAQREAALLAAAPSSRRVWKYIVVMNVGLVGAGLAASAIGAALPTGGADWIAWLLVGALFAAMAFFGRRLMPRDQDTGRAAPVTRVACDRCGAPVELAAGDHAATCRSCRAVGVPSATIQADLALAAHDQRRGAELERARGERGMLRSNARSFDWARRSSPYMRLAPLVFLPCVATVASLGLIARAIARGSDRELGDALDVLPVAGGLLAVAIGVLAFVRRRERIANAPIERSLRALATRLGADVELGSTPALDWLDRWWPGPAPSALHFTGYDRARWAVGGTAAGVPVLVVVVRASEPGEPGTYVLAAAARSVAAHAGASAAPTSAVREAQRLGFRFERTVDGVALAHGEATLAGSVQTLARAVELAAVLAGEDDGVAHDGGRGAWVPEATAVSANRAPMVPALERAEASLCARGRADTLDPSAPSRSTRA